MTIDWTRKRKLPRFAAVILRAVEALLVLAALAPAARWVYQRWNQYELIERPGWLADYARVKAILEWNYPNLDGAITDRRLDLPRLDARTTKRLEESHSRREAEAILRDFVAAFHDGHLTLARPGDPWTFDGKPADALLSASAPPAKACELLGYGDTAENDLGLDFRRVAPFVPFEDENPFAAGIVRIGERRVGLVRIPSFNSRAYGSVCAREWERYRRRLTTTCESACEADFQAVITARLLDALGSRIGELETAGVDLLAVDVRRNGGGSGRFEEKAAELLAGRSVPGPRIAVTAARVRGGALALTALEIERALAICPGRSDARRRLEEAYWRVERARADAAVPCDRSAVWRDWGIRPSCDGLVAFDDFDGRTWAELDPRRAGDDASSALDPLPRRARWHGPLAVVTDRWTGSAAELLAGGLHDYAGALVLGQRTAGSGGGWFFGRSSWELSHSRLRLYVPDFVDYRRDGSSYHAGVTPDIFVRFADGDSGVVKAHALVEGLRQALARQRGTTRTAPGGTHE